MGKLSDQPTVQSKLPNELELNHPIVSRSERTWERNNTAPAKTEGRQSLDFSVANSLGEISQGPKSSKA